MNMLLSLLCAAAWAAGAQDAGAAAAKRLEAVTESSGALSARPPADERLRDSLGPRRGSGPSAAAGGKLDPASGGTGNAKLTVASAIRSLIGQKMRYTGPDGNKYSVALKFADIRFDREVSLRVKQGGVSLRRQAWEFQASGWRVYVDVETGKILKTVPLFKA